MMGDMMDSAVDTEDAEEETDAEVDKVLFEVAGESVAALAGAKAPTAKKAQPSAVEDEEPTEQVEDDLQSRLDAIRS
jgi:charged multivesicular body protein 3